MTTITYDTNDYIMKIINYPGMTPCDVKITFKKDDVRNMTIVWKRGTILNVVTPGKVEGFVTDAITCMYAMQTYNVEDDYRNHLNATLACLHCVMNPGDAPDRRSWTYARDTLMPLLVALLCYIMKRHDDDE